jgi:hypothetical protein
MKRQRKTEKCVVVRDNKLGGREKNLSSLLKAPRQCPLFLPEGVKLRLS